MKDYKPMKARFRATFAAGTTAEPRIGNVDRENGVLHDVQITLEGEAKGHGVWLDRQFCEDVCAAGNKMDAGVKVRFGHPAMCSDALGTYLGRAKNFRVGEFNRKFPEEDGTEKIVPCAGVIADVELDKNADRTEWVLNMSESAPDTFGQSIVFTYSDWKVKDADGVDHSFNGECGEGVEDEKQRKSREDWEAQSADGRVYAVLGKLHGTDFTDTPAATDGVFAETTLAEEAERMLDEHPQILETLEQHPDNVYQFLSRIGILDRIESKRVSGIQAEKDREIAALKAIVAERDALLKKTVEDSCIALEEARAETDAVKEKFASANKEFEASKLALAESEKAREQLAADVEAGSRALAELREQLERLNARHAEIVGTALNAVKPHRKSYTEVLASRDATPEQRLEAALEEVKARNK